MVFRPLMLGVAMFLAHMESEMEEQFGYNESERDLGEHNLLHKIDDFLADDLGMGHLHLTREFDRAHHLVEGPIPSPIQNEIQTELAPGHEPVHYRISDGNLNGGVNDIYRFVGKDGNEHEIVTGVDSDGRTFETYLVKDSDNSHWVRDPSHQTQIDGNLGALPDNQLAQYKVTTGDTSYIHDWPGDGQYLSGHEYTKYVVDDTTIFRYDDPPGKHHEIIHGKDRGA